MLRKILAIGLILTLVAVAVNTMSTAWAQEEDEWLRLKNWGLKMDKGKKSDKAHNLSKTQGVNSKASSYNAMVTNASRLNAAGLAVKNGDVVRVEPIIRYKITVIKSSQRSLQGKSEVIGP